MRVTYILLMTAAALLTSGSALSIEGDAGTRHLRTLKTVNNLSDAEEERAGAVVDPPFHHTFDFNWWDDLVHKLPEQFQRMRIQPEFLRFIYNSWETSYRTLDDVVAFMKREKLSEKAIEQFKTALIAYREHIAEVAKAAEAAKAIT